MNDQPSIKTLGVITFARCGVNERDLFRVNPDVPLREAMEHVSNLFHCAKHLALDAAMEQNGQRYAWASHYLCEMGKAVIDDLSQRLLHSEPLGQDC